MIPDLRDCVSTTPTPVARLAIALVVLNLSTACTNMAITAGFTSSASLASSATSSQAVSSPFKSSSNSSASPPVQPEKKTEEEIRIYTASYLRAGSGSAETFAAGIAGIAASHGISDWESLPGIWISVGYGLGESGLDDRQVAGYVRAWSGGDETIAALQRRGVRLASTRQ